MNLNEAIWAVLTSKYKKDAPNAFKLVEKYYDVYKSGDGHWCVRNGKIYKSVCISRDGQYIDYGRNRKLIKDNTKDHFDFERCLNTPFNTEYFRTVQYGKAKETWSNIQRKEWYVQSDINDIEHIKNQIIALNKQLADRIKSKTDHQKSLRDARYGAKLKSSMLCWI